MVPIDAVSKAPLPNPSFKATYEASEASSNGFTILITSQSGNTFHGWSVIVTYNSVMVHSSYGQTSSWATLPQTDAWALRTACRYAIDHNITNSIILTDSKALISQLRGSRCGSTLVKDCWELLNTLATNNSVLVAFDKSKQDSNWCEASRLAKLALTGDYDPPDEMPIQPIALKGLINAHMIRNWNQSWQRPDPRGFQYRQTRRFWPVVDLNTSKSLLKLDRITLSRIIQLCTGHGYNAYHLSLANPSRDRECRYCLEDEEETWQNCE